MVAFRNTDTSGRTTGLLLRCVLYSLLALGLIILGAGSKTIRWSPPLILTKENVDVALEIFDEAIAASN